MDFQEWQVTVVTGLFVFFIVWDISWNIVKQRIEGLSWIPGKALVLSALTVQLVGYFEKKNIDIFGKSEEEQLKLFIDNQLTIDGARLCFCVFLGYIQPGMASSKSGGRWSNIAALVLSLSLHVGTEIFALENVSEATKLRNEEFISSSVVFLVGATCLVIYLGCTVLAGKFIRDSVSQKIPQILSKNLPEDDKLSSFRGKISQILSENPPELDTLSSFREKFSQILSENPLEGDKLSSFREKMFKSWTVAFAWKAQYKLASAAFVPAVGMIVTICVAVVGNKARHLLHHGSDLGLASYLQCVFVIIGWISILCRWFMVAPLLYGSSTNRQLGDVFHCTNRFKDLVFLYMRIELNPRQLISESCLKLRKPSTILWTTVALLTWTIFFILLIPVIIFIAVIHLLFYISFLSWLFSEILFFLGIMIIGALAHVPGLASMVDITIDEEESAAGTDGDKEFLKCNEILQQMFQGVQKDKDVDRLWKYHLKSYNQRKPRMKEAYEEIQECQELFKVFSVGENGGNCVKELQNSNLPFKMVAVAMIDIIVRLLKEFGWGLEMDVGVQDIIKAYKEINDLLVFVDCPGNIAIDPMDMFGTCNFEAFEMSMEADKHIRWIEKQIKQHPGEKPQQTPTRQHILNFLKKEKEELDEAMKNSESEKNKKDFYFDCWFCGPFIFPCILPCFISCCTTSIILMRVEKLLEPVNKSLNGMDGCLGCVVKCLWCVVKSLGYLLLSCIMLILLLLFGLISLLFVNDDMTKFGYNKDMTFKKSRHFVYIPILDSYISDLENNNNIEDGKIIISSLGNEMIGCFRELIHCCAEKLPVLLIKQSNKWAEEFQEDKISKALEIAEKLIALMEMSKTRNIGHTDVNVNKVIKRTEIETEVENEIRIDLMNSE